MVRPRDASLSHAPNTDRSILINCSSDDLNAIFFDLMGVKIPSREHLVTNSSLGIDLFSNTYMSQLTYQTEHQQHISMLEPRPSHYIRAPREFLNLHQYYSPPSTPNISH
jgi:hypothetical protein